MYKVRDSLFYQEITEKAQKMLPGPPLFMIQAIRDIGAERQRQIDTEGWSPEHDDTHNLGELAQAAAAYATVSSAQARGASADEFTAGMMVGGGEWPWAEEWWKPKEPRRNLIRAGALIVAEIERLDRLNEAKK